MIKTRFCSTIFLLLLFVNTALAEIVPVKTLNGGLAGVKIVRILPVKTPQDQAHISQLKSFFIRTFEEGYDYLFDSVFKLRGLTRADVTKRFDDAFSESVSALGENNSVQDFYFLEALDPDGDQPVGTASFKKLKDPTEVYLFNFAATYFRDKTQRGIGRQLLKAVRDVVPGVKTVHLVVRKQHSRVLAIYRHWGFVDSDYVDPVYPKEDFPGMTLQGDALQKFLID